MSLAEHVRTLGRGPGRSRSLTLAEAEDAMGQMLAGDAAPEAVGALLMLMRMKGETAEEIAGFSRAAQTDLPALPQGDLNWPSYAAGRTRGLPLFLLSAKLVAQAGFRVLVHGRNGSERAVRAGLAPLGIARVLPGETLPDLAYMALEDMTPSLTKLLSLREVLGLRSCINTVCRMLNPGRARATVQGVFHPSYRTLQADAAAILGWENLTVIKGGGGEFERHPGKPIEGFGLRDGAPWEAAWPPALAATRRLDDGARDPTRLAQLWAGEIPDPFAEAVIVTTAATALETLRAPQPAALAQDLWTTRHRARAA